MQPSSFDITSQSPYSPPWQYLHQGMKAFSEVASEAIGFAIASMAVRMIAPPLSAPLKGIAAGLLTGKLVIKILTPYNSQALMDLTYDACLLREQYPKLQTIASVFALSISFLSPALGILSGLVVGFYGALIIDVENYKLMQKLDRKALLERGLN